MAATRFDYYNTGDDAMVQIAPLEPAAQSFTVETTYDISSVKLKLYKSDTYAPGTITVSIRAVSGDEPFGEDLISGTTDGDTLTDISPGEWREITFDRNLVLTAGVKYTIVVFVAGGAPLQWSLFWRNDGTAPTYTGGMALASEDGGITWDSYAAADYMFECWGETPSFEAPSERVTIKKLVAFADNKAYYET